MVLSSNRSASFVQQGSQVLFQRMPTQSVEEWAQTGMRQATDGSCGRQERRESGVAQTNSRATSAAPAPAASARRGVRSQTALTRRWVLSKKKNWDEAAWTFAVALFLDISLDGGDTSAAKKAVDGCDDDSTVALALSMITYKDTTDPRIRSSIMYNKATDQANKKMQATTEGCRVDWFCRSLYLWCGCVHHLSCAHEGTMRRSPSHAAGD